MRPPQLDNGLRFVRVGVCEPSDSAACTQVQYRSLLPLVDLPVYLPRATKIVAVDSLGFSPGDTPCL